MERHAVITVDRSVHIAVYNCIYKAHYQVKNTGQLGKLPDIGGAVSVGRGCIEVKRMIIPILPRAKANYRFNDEEKAAVNVGSNVTGYRTINDKTQKRLISLIPGICIVTFGLYLSLTAYFGVNTIKLLIIFTDIAAVIAFLIFGIGPLIRAVAAEGRRRRCTVPAKAEFVSSDVIEPDNESGIGPIVKGCYYSYYYMGDGYKLYVSTKDAKNIDYKGEFDIMTDPGHPERYYNERLMRYDLGKAVKNAVLLLLAAAAVVTFLFFAWKIEAKYRKEPPTALVLTEE